METAPREHTTTASNRQPDPELGCRLGTVEWAIIAARLPWRTHMERIHDLEALGVLPDEANFARMASGLPR